MSWSEVARSPQLSKFLKHIVEAKLRGDEASIKAYSIAVDVFGRPATFDPQADPIVRVQARRLRGLLQEFYRQNLGTSDTRITLPVGRYVPEFESLGPTAADAEASRRGVPLLEPAGDAAAARRFGRRFWVQAGAATALLILLGVLLAGLQILRAPEAPPVDPTLPREPTVYVSAFSNLTGAPALDAFVSRLNDQLGSTLAQFEDVQVGFIQPGLPMETAEGSYLLSGTVAAIASGIEITAVLTDAVTGSAVWNKGFYQPTPSAEDILVASNAARKIMRDLGPFRGPIHAHGRKWLDEHTAQIPAVNGYICLLTYRYARESINSAAIAKAIDCYDRLRKQQPGLPLAMAAEAWLTGRVIYHSVRPGDRVDLAVAEPQKLAQQARSTAPESSFVHEQLASVQNWAEDYDIAQHNYAIALGFEPLNTDARAGYAITLARMGDWSEAAQQAQFAIADTPFPSPWYYYLPSLIALRDGRLEQSIEDGRIAAQSGELGTIVALAAGGLAQDAQAIGDFQPRVMSSESLRRVGIMPWLGIRIKDRAVLARIEEGLRAGGIPESALTAQF